LPWLPLAPFWPLLAVQTRCFTPYFPTTVLHVVVGLGLGLPDGCAIATTGTAIAVAMAVATLAVNDLRNILLPPFGLLPC
jgi:hypothetical protein